MKLDLTNPKLTEAKLRWYIHRCELNGFATLGDLGELVQEYMKWTDLEPKTWVEDGATYVSLKYSTPTGRDCFEELVRRAKLSIQKTKTQLCA